MNAWAVLRFIVRERRYRDALKLILLAVALLGLLVLKALEPRIVGHAPSAWWFYLLAGAGFVAFLALLEWLYRRYEL